MAFAFGGMLITHGLQKIAWGYFPYLTVEIPLIAERTALACSTVKVRVIRDAWYSMDVSVTTQLTRLEANGDTDKIFIFQNDTIIPQGKTEMTKHYPVPCDTPPGTYYYEGIAKFKAGDVTRRLPFYTSTFEVIK